jgi:rhodanese-related sulfurtransferase
MGDKDVERIGVEQAREEIAGGDAQAVDVRDDDAWNDGHPPGAIHIPRDRLESDTDELDSDGRVAVFADDDDAAAEAASLLRERGFEAVAVKGGMDAWKSEGFNLQPSPDPDEDAEIEPDSSPDPDEDAESESD